MDEDVLRRAVDQADAQVMTTIRSASQAQSMLRQLIDGRVANAERLALDDVEQATVLLRRASILLDGAAAQMTLDEARREELFW